MATALGINNPNSRYNRSLREPYIPALPLSRDAHIRNLESAIRGTDMLRTFRFRIGDIPGARLQAIRLGTMRNELRQLKAAQS